MNTVNRQFVIGEFRAQRGQISASYQALNTGVVRFYYLGKQGRFIGDVTMPQPIRRGCQPHDAQGRIDRCQRVDQFAVSALLLMRYPVRLIYDHQINMPYLVGTLLDRLNARKRDLFGQIMPPHSRRIDTEWRIRPVLQYLFGVLFDQFLDVGQHQNAAFRRRLHRVNT